MYTQYFGLRGKPFQLTPDVGFFYPSEEHNRALAFLEYGVHQADGFIVITGDVGTGKSTVLQALLQRLDPDEMRVASVVTSRLSQGDLLYLVASNLGIELESQSKALILKELQRFLVIEAEAGRRVLLIIDEAQGLPDESVEELRMLSNFQLDGQPLLQIFLVGQSELRAMLLSPGLEQLRQRVIATYHLNPLNEVETRTYIEHRLNQVDWANDPEFTDDAFPAIFEATDGVPRRINNLCDRLLLYTYLEELHRIDSRIVKLVFQEIGAEFSYGMPVTASQPASDAAAPVESQDAELRVFDKPGEPLEAMARVMFDKANVQQRLAALERALDRLGNQLKPEVAEVREELGYVRGVVEDILTEVRSHNLDPSRKRRA
jgi:general secretion pathway protein A